MSEHQIVVTMLQNLGIANIFKWKNPQTSKQMNKQTLTFFASWQVYSQILEIMMSMWILWWIRRRRWKKAPTMLGISHTTEISLEIHSNLVGSVCGFNIKFIYIFGFVSQVSINCWTKVFVDVFFSIYTLYYRLSLPSTFFVVLFFFFNCSL